MKARHLYLAALSGVLATVSMVLAPWWGGIPPLMNPPWIPIDLRYVLPTVAFVGAHLLGTRSSWPGPAVALSMVAVPTAITAHLHASAALDFAGVAWAEPGVRIGILGLAASLGSVLVALLVALEVATDRFQLHAEAIGVPDDEIAPARAQARRLTEGALTTGALAAAVLGLTLRIVDQFLGASQLPLPELFALGIVLAVGAVFVGWRSQPTY